MNINITVNVEKTGDASFDRLVASQIRFAGSLAINKSLAFMKEAQVREMKAKFRNPVPYTLNSVATKASNKSNLTGSVFLREFAGKGTPASKFLEPQVFGGGRRNKRFERALALRGLIPNGYYALPYFEGGAVQRDAYGNPSRGLYNRILSQLGAQTDPAQNETAQSRKKGRGRPSARYFIIRNEAKLPVGIFTRKRKGEKPVMVFAFVPSVKYRQRYDFFRVNEDTLNVVFPKMWSAALDQSIRTAR